MLDDSDEWDDQDEVAPDDAEPERDVRGQGRQTPRGMVATATRARGRVPYLLDEVIRAGVAVRRAERELSKAVARARAHGATWEEVGLATGMTRQGATKRFR